VPLWLMILGRVVLAVGLVSVARRLNRLVDDTQPDPAAQRSSPVRRIGLRLVGPGRSVRSGVVRRPGSHDGSIATDPTHRASVVAACRRAFEGSRVLVARRRHGHATGQVAPRTLPAGPRVQEPPCAHPDAIYGSPSGLVRVAVGRSCDLPAAAPSVGICVASDRWSNQASMRWSSVREAAWAYAVLACAWRPVRARRAARVAW
jgi:hypothetical protein